MNKYRVSPKTKRTAFGIVFDSKLEMQHYMVLMSRRQEGLIGPIELQPTFLLQKAFIDNTGKKHRKIEYVADFAYDQLDIEEGDRIIEDTKGHPTPVFRLKEKLFRYKYPNKILRIVTQPTLD